MRSRLIVPKRGGEHEQSPHVVGGSDRQRAGLVLPLFLLGVLTQILYGVLAGWISPLLDAMPGTVFRNEVLRFVTVVVAIVLLALLVGALARTRDGPSQVIVSTLTKSRGVVSRPEMPPSAGGTGPQAKRCRRGSGASSG
jgi:hypothetical protein